MELCGGGIQLRDLVTQQPVHSRHRAHGIADCVVGHGPRVRGDRRAHGPEERVGDVPHRAIVPHRPGRGDEQRRAGIDGRQHALGSGGGDVGGDDNGVHVGGEGRRVDRRQIDRAAERHGDASLDPRLGGGQLHRVGDELRRLRPERDLENGRLLRGEQCLEPLPPALGIGRR